MVYFTDIERVNYPPGGFLAFRYGNREQVDLLPPSISDYVGPDDPVRAYDAFVDALDFSQLGIDEDPDCVGNTQYDPRAMVKLFVYGYSYSSERSSRKLERALYHNNSFIWLMGGLKPDHKTIARFRRDNKSALEKILRQSARMCLKLGLIKGNTLFIDGTKIRADASLSNTWNKARCDRALEKADQKIRDILQEAERLDGEDASAPSLVKLQDELSKHEALKEKVREILKELNEEQRTSLNTTDKDCVSTRSTHGSYAGYNAQIATDEENGLIASCDVVAASNDQGLLAGQIENATETLEKECEITVADAGYSDLEDIATIPEKTNVLVPIQRQKDDQFVYDKESDTFTCPEGQQMRRCTTDKKKKRWRYKVTDGDKCRQCSQFGSCTTNKKGRIISRSFFEDIAERVQDNLQLPQSQQKYELRKQKVELPFGHMRRTLGVSSFLLRGLRGVKAEFSLFSTAFNIQRMITLLGGVQPFVRAMKA
jgi:transposase